MCCIKQTLYKLAKPDHDLDLKLIFLFRFEKRWYQLQNSCQQVFQILGVKIHWLGGPRERKGIKQGGCKQIKCLPIFEIRKLE